MQTLSRTNKSVFVGIMRDARGAKRPLFMRMIDTSIIPDQPNSTLGGNKFRLFTVRDRTLEKMTESEPNLTTQINRAALHEPDFTVQGRTLFYRTMSFADEVAETGEFAPLSNVHALALFHSHGEGMTIRSRRHADKFRPKDRNGETLTARRLKAELAGKAKIG